MPLHESIHQGDAIVAIVGKTNNVVPIFRRAPLLVLQSQLR